MGNLKVGDRVVRNPATWQPNEFDSWDRGIGISMHEDDSPNRSPNTIGSIDTSANSSLTRSTISTLAYWGLPMIGGIAGFVGYIFPSITLECHDTATESIRHMANKQASYHFQCVR